MLAHTKPLETKVYNEIVGRLQQDDSTVPYLMNGYWYFRRFETGKEYPIYSRRARQPERARRNPARTSTSSRRATTSSRSATSPISPDSKLMAWAEDTVGRRQYVVKVMELATRKVFPHRVAQRREQHRLGRRQQDLSLHRERSRNAARLPGAQPPARQREPRRRRRGSAGVGAEGRRASTRSSARTKDEKYLLIHTQSTVSSEVWFADATASEARIQAVPAARARSRIPGGARERPLDRAHQLPGEELPHRRSAAAATKAIARSGKTSSRIATTRSSTRTTCRATSSPSRSIRAACASCASARGIGPARRRVRHGGRAQLHDGARRQSRIRQRQAALHLHVAGHAAAPPTTTTSRPARARDAQARAGARRLRPGELRHRVRVGHGARRREGAGIDRLREDHAARRHRAAAADRIRIVRHRRTIPNSRTCRRRCSTAASSSPSPTSAAARKWAARGTKTASC